MPSHDTLRRLSKSLVAACAATPLAVFVLATGCSGAAPGEISIYLDAGDNLVYTTDFRRVYATMISGWLGYKDTRTLLNGDFAPFDMFSKA